MKSLLVVISFVLTGAVYSQATKIPLLEQKISLVAQQMPMIEVMELLEEKGNFSFSYAPALVQPDKIVSMRAANRPLREVLGKLFGKSIRVREKGRYIILSENTDDEKMTIGGYVQNSKGEPVRDVTLYDPGSLVSANTNEYGYYEMKISKRPHPLQVTVRKIDYHDTLIPVQPDSSALSNIIIREEPRDSTITRVLRAAGGLAHEKWSTWSAFVFPENPELQNVNDTIYRRFQFSVLPLVGTNRKLSGNVINDWSLNLFGGYNMGVRKAEFGGLFNMNRAGVKYVQLGGLYNMNGGRLDGLQMAGLINVSGANTHGVQLAGLINYANDTIEGLQMSGLLNINRAYANGFCAAGFANISAQRMTGFQAAGFLNLSADTMNGFQVAGFTNIASHVEGMQLSGFANIAGSVNGSQLAPFNFCDTITGVPVGFLSFVNRGYHTLEISANDIFPLNVSFRTGVRKFYTSLHAGMKLNDLDTNYWSMGYGIGTSPKLARNLFLNIDLSSHYISQGVIDDKFNLDNQLYLGVDYSITKKLAVSAGGILHGHLTERYELYPDVYNHGEPSYIATEYWDRLQARFWIGWKVAVRFF